MAFGRVSVELEWFWQLRGSGSDAGSGHACGGGMKQRGNVVFVHQRECFLGFAERVTEEDRGFVLSETFAHESENFIFNFGSFRKPVAWQAEGGFHDECVGLRECDLFGGAARADFKIAGIEQAGLICEARDVDHCRAGDVAGGEQRDAEIFVGE